MTNPDRKNPPPFKEIEKIEVLRAQKNFLKNGIPVYTVNAGTEDVIKIDLIFKAGIFPSFQRHSSFYTPLLASTANHLVPEGTARLSSTEIAENIDYFGAFIQSDCDKDIAGISLITLNKHLKSTLPILEEIVKGAVFPEREVNTYLQNIKQKFLVETEKVQVIARRKFNEIIFGEKHPYGKNVEAEDFDKVGRQELLDFFSDEYKPSNCFLIVSGKVKDEVLSLIEEYFGKWESASGLSEKNEFIPGIVKDDERKHFVEKAGQVQSAIRIGRLLFSKNHPHYPAMKVLNVVLGGYFGSRLMNNIREDKGYTYGIGSAVFPFVHEGCFFISTEVGRDVTNESLKEIYYELAKIREDEITTDELQKVRNYMLGEFIRSIDGPFALADRLKGLLVFGLDYDYYDSFISAIKTTSPQELRELAQMYLQEKDLSEVVVGSRILK